MNLNSIGDTITIPTAPISTQQNNFLESSSPIVVNDLTTSSNLLDISSLTLDKVNVDYGVSGGESSSNASSSVLRADICVS